MTDRYHVTELKGTQLQYPPKGNPSQPLGAKQKALNTPRC